MRKQSYLLLMSVLLLAASSQAASSPIDLEHSSLAIHVFKSGLFSGFAHEHEIVAPLSSGVVDQAALSVEVHFDAQRLKVMDPDASPSDRAKVEETMLSDKVLDAARFREIAFVSHKVQPAGNDSYAVEGDLTLHGITRPLTISVVRENQHYKGNVKLKQSDFGIRPISLAGGSVKVKDVVEISFDIVLQAR